MERGIYNSSDGFVIVDFGKRLEMGMSLAREGVTKVSYVGFRDERPDNEEEQKVALFFDNTESIDNLVECLGYVKKYIQGVSEEDFPNFDRKLDECVCRFNTKRSSLVEGKSNCRE